jgi:hypothetical protein
MAGSARALKLSLCKNMDVSHSNAIGFQLCYRPELGKSLENIKYLIITYYCALVFDSEISLD